MKVIDVKDQVRLPLSKCMELVLSGIKYRLFRAAVTVGIVALAVAFLMTMLTEGFIARRVAEEISVRTAPRHLFNFVTGRLSAPMPGQELTRELAAMTPGDQRWTEFKAWGGLSDDDLSGLADVARRQLPYRAFFSETLEEGERRPLVGRARGTEIFELLVDEQAFDNFQEEFYSLGVQMDTDLEQFKTFLADWSSTKGKRQAIRDGNKRALAALRADLGGQEPKGLLATADESILAALAKHDFQLNAEQLGIVRYQAGLSIEAEQLLRLLSVGTVKNRLSDRRNVDLKDVDATEFFSEVSSSKGARWLRDLVTEMVDKIAELEKALPQLRGQVAEAKRQEADLLENLDAARENLANLAKAKAKASADQIEAAEDKVKLAENALSDLGLDKLQADLKRANTNATVLLPSRVNIEGFALSAERIEEVADSRISQTRLAKVETSVERSASGSGRFMGFSSRTLWLIAVSFMVCVVGITNAMLMSVTDRFREIATMKCLGATDGFIMVNFIFESCLQGTAGGILGALLGFLLGMLRSLISYGWIAIEHMPMNLILATGGAALVAGVVLSAFAAVYPAWIAARLAPMEAMRIE